MMIRAATLVLFVAAALGQDLEAARQRSWLERVALDRAREALWEQVAAVPLLNNLTLGTWAARDIGRERALRFWVYDQPLVGAARHQDGVVEADIRVEAEALCAKLLEMIGDADGGDSVAEAIGSAKLTPLSAIGRAAVTEYQSVEKPEGWEPVSLEGIELARRAASAEAIYALLESTGQMKVTNALRVQQFIEASDEIRDAVREALLAAARMEVRFERDQVAVSEATVHISEVIRILTAVHQQHYKEGDFRAEDFREMALIAAAERIAVAGMATPPKDTVRKWSPPAAAQSPASQPVATQPTPTTKATTATAPAESQPTTQPATSQSGLDDWPD